MMQLLFRNRFAALAWVCMSLFSAAAFVSDGGGHEQLDRAAAQIKAERVQAAAPRPAHTFPPAWKDQQDDWGIDTETSEQNHPAAGSAGREFQGTDGRRYRVLTAEEAARLQGGSAGQ